MKKKNVSLLWGAALPAFILAACSGAQKVSSSNGGSIHAGDVPKYVQPPRATYGEWYIEPRTCTIRARAAEFSLITDGRPDTGTLNVKALFTTPLVQPPHVEISELLAPVPVEGTWRGYNIILAYDPTTAAQMLEPDTYLMVRYQPMYSAIVLESSFSTRGLMQALADLAKYC